MLPQMTKVYTRENKRTNTHIQYALKDVKEGKNTEYTNENNYIKMKILKTSKVYATFTYQKYRRVKIL